MTDGSARRHIELRLIENSRMIAITRVVTAVFSLVTVPVIVTRLGLTGYGAWESMLATAALTAIFIGPVSGTLMWRISTAFGAKDLPEIQRLARVGAGVVLALFVLVLPLAWWSRHEVVGWLQVPGGLEAGGAAVFPAVVAVLLLGGLCDTLDAVTSGCQRSGLVNIGGAVALIGNYTVVIIALAAGAGIWGLVMGQAAGMAIRFICSSIAARHAYGPISLLPMLPRRSDVEAAWYSGLMAIGYVAGSLRDQTDKVVLAIFASPTWTGYYGIAARLAGLVLEVVRFLYVPVITAAGAIHASGDWEGIRRLYSKVIGTLSGVAGLVLALTAGLSGGLVVLWLGRPIPQVLPLLWILVVGNSAAVILTGAGTSISRGLGRVDIETRYIVFNLVCNLALTVGLVLAVGAVGTVYATGITWVLSAVLFAFILHRQLELPTAATWQAGGRMIVGCVIGAVLSWIFLQVGLPTTRQGAFLMLAWLAPLGVVLYALSLLLARLVSVDEMRAGVRRFVPRLG